ncbi:MAG: hypothetical protein U5K30_02520 [Acidimicrobiales bacterium]|nr:hypothetical protein [Acidimicrobiales bacterium]
MRSERYVALGLARVRTPWFTDVARWATSGSIAMDFVKTVSVEEVRARLDSGRPFSALLIDGGLAGIDRDLFAHAREHDCAVVVVSDTDRDWAMVGATATLPSGFDLHALESVLADVAAPIGLADDLPGQPAGDESGPGYRAPTIAVTGPGGTGRSITAIALAQGFAADVTHADTVVLADLALHADQAMLHDARDVIPGVLELVESHRSGTPVPEDVRSLTFDIVERRYRLLLGLRRHRDWTALRPRALRAGLDGLRQAFTLVVADIDDDLEDETVTGSADVQDRNLLARTTVGLADVLVVVGTPGAKGVHSLLRVVRDCLAAGVDADRLLVVVNRTARRGTQRAETARAITELLVASHPDETILSPVFLPERRQLDDLLRDGARLPATLVDPLTAAVRDRLDAVTRPDTARSIDEPVPVAVGSLGHWDEEVAG